MIVSTKYGKVEGVKEGRFEVFKNIPFAKPPVGELRFQPPVEPDRWDGVLDATKFGPRAMQDPLNPDNAGAVMSEADCLNLNIWTPACDGKKRPVVVHIHGGGHCFGWNSEDCFDGEHFIAHRDEVMVAIQYRLGVFGYMYLGELLGEKYKASGSLGLLDQILSLRWIRDNIAAFGGDPDNVTIMGESAGGRSVGGTVMSPLADGLYHKAITQSGGVPTIRDVKSAARATEEILPFLGLTKETAAEILTMDADKIVEGQRAFCASVSNMVNFLDAVIDGVVITETPEERIGSGKVKHIPLLVGANMDELRFPIPEETDIDAYIDFSLRTFGKNRPYVETQLQKRLETMSKKDAIADIMTTYIYGNNAPRMAGLWAKGGGKVWLYRWDHTKNTVPLAHHFSEMCYIFNFTVDEYHKGYPDTEENRALAKLMNDIWNNFVLTGDPNTDGLPQWKPYTSFGPGKRMHLKTAAYTEDYDLSKDCDLEMPVQIMIL